MLAPEPCSTLTNRYQVAQKHHKRSLLALEIHSIILNSKAAAALKVGAQSQYKCTHNTVSNTLLNFSHYLTFQFFQTTGEIQWTCILPFTSQRWKITLQDTVDPFISVHCLRMLSGLSALGISM